MDRIQIILQGQEFEACRGAMERARAAALFPDRISFGLALTQTPDAAAERAIRGLGQVRVACPSQDKWLDMPEMWQGERYVLMGQVTMKFDRLWDVYLLRTLRELQRRRQSPVLLTGFLPRTEDLVDAVCPVTAGGFDAAGHIQLTRGTPLRYAAAPIRSGFINRDFCLARADAFRQLAGAQDRTLAAFAMHSEAYTLHKPWIRLDRDEPLPPVDPQADPETARRFGERFGIDMKTRQIGVAAREGVHEPTFSFRTRIPTALRVQETLRRLAGARSRTTPLVVSAWLENAEQPDMDLAMLRLRRLSSIRAVSLLCFADERNARRVQLSHPNVVAFKPRHGLPVPGRVDEADLPRYVRLCRPFLLSRGREKLLNHSHYVWMDMDYLTWPVYAGAALDWETVCCERISMAMVDGEPDLSMICVPEERLLTLCQEFAAICGKRSASEGRLPDDMEVWKQLLREHPEWFRMTELPGRGELFSLTMSARGEEWLTKQ